MAIRWLVIGVGDITTKRVLPAIQAEPRSTLVGIVTRNPSKAEPYGVPGWTSLDVALAEQECDAVYVASPVALHAQQTIASLRAGRNVLCEKPMAMNYDEALSMQRMAQQTGRTLGIAYYRRMYPQVDRALELIRQKAIGEPVFAEATSHYWFCPGPEDERSWFIDPAMAGRGPLYDIASHRIDLMNYLFGKPSRASALTSNAVHQYAVEDNATVMVEYDSGVRGVIDVRWHSRVFRDEFRIRGTDGEIDMTPLNSGVLIYPGGREDLPPHENLHYPCVADFVTALLAGTEPRSSGATALVTAWVTDEAIRSSAP
ncbi:MAG TPA: Gfo/Idh/MocA family oxidoreductase [Bryobacteraceae bacterium]|nr:Gfo/Idh/MocA family oxidoreductase [Bryobacteraceae bacterium]